MTISDLKKELTSRAEKSRKDQHRAASNCQYESAGVYRGRAEAYEEAIFMLNGVTS